MGGMDGQTLMMIERQLPTGSTPICVGPPEKGGASLEAYSEGTLKQLDHLTVWSFKKAEANRDDAGAIGGVQLRRSWLHRDFGPRGSRPFAHCVESVRPQAEMDNGPI